MDKIKEWKLLISFLSSIVFFTITGYTVYLDIYKKIEINTNQIELTQLSILKSQINFLEKYPCKTSRDEWAEYNMLFSQYYKLLKKHNPLLDDLHIKPMKRLEKDSCRCFKGVCSE
jgi:hemerythrin superfamily protein